MVTCYEKKFKCCKCSDIIEKGFDLVYYCNCTPDTVYCYNCYRCILLCKNCKAEMIDNIDSHLDVDEDLKTALSNSLKEITTPSCPPSCPPSSPIADITLPQVPSNFFSHKSPFSPLPPLLSPETLQFYTNFKKENGEPLYDSTGNAIKVGIKKEDSNAPQCTDDYLSNPQNIFNLTGENNKNPFQGFESSFKKITNHGKLVKKDDSYTKIPRISEVLESKLSLSVIKQKKECIICTCVTETTENTSCSSCKKYICRYCYISSKPFCNNCITTIKSCSKCTILLEKDHIYRCACFSPETPAFNNSSNPNSVCKIFCEECTIDEICQTCKNYYNCTNYFTCQSCIIRKHRRNGKIYFCKCNSEVLSTLSYPKLFLCEECDRKYDVSCPNCNSVFNDNKIEFEQDEFRGYVIPTTLYIACMTKYGYFYNSDSYKADQIKNTNTPAYTDVVKTKEIESKTIQINGYTCV